MHLLIDAIAAAQLFRYGTWMREAVHGSLRIIHPSGRGERAHMLSANLSTGELPNGKRANT
jgi:hypothetical protein